MACHQYKLTVGDSIIIGDVGSNELAIRWGEIADHIEERGYTAKLEQRIIFYDDDILKMTPTPEIYMQMDGKVIGPWEYVAEFRDDREVIMVIANPDL